MQSHRPTYEIASWIRRLPTLSTTHYNVRRSEPFPVLPILVGWGDIRFCESQERHETEREEQAGRPKVVQYAQQVDLTAEFGSGAQRDRYRKATSNSRQDGVQHAIVVREQQHPDCLLYTSPSPRDRTRSRMPSSA